MATNALPLSKQVCTVEESRLSGLGFGSFTFAVSEHYSRCAALRPRHRTTVLVEVKEIRITKINLEGTLCRNFLCITQTLTFWPPAASKKSSFRQSG